MNRLLLFAMILVVGCQSGGGSTGRVTAREEFQLESLDTVAYMGLAQAVPDELSIRMMEPVIQDHLLAGASSFVILPMHEIESRARQAGVSATYQAVRDYWRDSKKVDKFKLKELCEATGVQAILLGVVEDWTQVQTNLSADEPAYTRLSASLGLYLGETGRRVWRTRHSKIFEAAQLDGGTETGNRGTGVAMRRTGADAPRYEDVLPEFVEKLVCDLVK